ncbi:MAG: hypothetical protein KKH92_04005, partial [Firmicutes bacterium]|nr:hypothetical protein [Bacillota bacterium]
MNLKLIHYMKWIMFSYCIIYLNILLLASIGVEYQNLYFFLAYILLCVIVLFDFLLNRRLGMKIDFIMIGILFVSALQMLIAF